jgi:hypothetical protein
MAKLGYTWYPKDWGNSESVFELNLSERGLYRELIDLAMMNDNKTEIKLDVWCRKFAIDLDGLKSIIDKLLKLNLIQINGENLFIPSCENRLNLVRGGKKSKPNQEAISNLKNQNYKDISEPISEPIPKPVSEQKEKEKETKIKKEIENNTASPFSFFNSLIQLGAKKELVSDWLKVRKTKKLTNTETAFSNLKIEFEKSGKPIDEILEKCITESWGGFKASWRWDNTTTTQKEKSEIVAGRQTMETIQKNLDTTGLYVPGVGDQ